MSFWHANSNFERWLPALGVLCMMAGSDAAGAASADDARRDAMVANIVRLMRETAAETGRAQLSDPVLRAMQRVPRHRFVGPDQEPVAYADRPLGIGAGQTISQPFIVALMTELLDVKPGMRVLEIGTGSGYQAAVLAELAVDVYSIEIIKELADVASARLRETGYTNVTTRVGDGYAGWPERAPFDAIVVTAAAPRVPPALVEQLRPGGRMVIPVGEPYGMQTLYVIEKNAAGETSRRPVLAVRFVPLTGRAQQR